MTLEEAMKMICDHRAKVKRTKDDWHDGYYDGLTAALLLLSEDKPADTDKPIWESKDKMTLKELAHEMRKVFDFKYLTAYEAAVELIKISLHRLKPKFNDPGMINWPFGWVLMDSNDGSVNFYHDRLAINLDLSEYKNADGNIDYSKCIVEVE